MPIPRYWRGHLVVQWGDLIHLSKEEAAGIMVAERVTLQPFINPSGQVYRVDIRFDFKDHPTALGSVDVETLEFLVDAIRARRDQQQGGVS